MNREDIIRMAREAGFNKQGRAPAYYAMPEEIERFAALVAAAEREACAKVCDDLSDKWVLGFREKDCADAIRARGRA